MPQTRPQFAARRRNYMQRAVDTTEIRQRFLIVCEGSKTEPNYFKQFRVPTLVIQVEGTGMNTLSLVDEAMRFRAEDEYDQVWCVFDKDDFPIDQFENAIQRARDNGMRVAYSNQSFELWYILHFEYLHAGLNRKAYMRKLNQHLGSEYKKNDPNMYQNLKLRKEAAIRNAQRLLMEYQPCHPGIDDPCTTVHELVIALQEQAKSLSRR